MREPAVSGACQSPSFEAFLNAEQSALLRFFRYRNVSPDNAEDIVQEVLTKFWQWCTAEPSRLESAGQHRGMLYTIAHNKLIDFVRKRTLATQDLSYLPIPGRSGSPFEWTLLAEVRSKLMTTLLLLPEGTTRAIVLSLVRNSKAGGCQSREEIEQYCLEYVYQVGQQSALTAYLCTELGISCDAVHTACCRVRQKLTRVALEGKL